METESSLPHSQEPATWPYPEPNQYFLPLFIISISIVSSKFLCSFCYFLLILNIIAHISPLIEVYHICLYFYHCLEFSPTVCLCHRCKDIFTVKLRYSTPVFLTNICDAISRVAINPGTVKQRIPVHRPSSAIREVDTISEFEYIFLIVQYT
jgi:hypothetical protein